MLRLENELGYKLFDRSHKGGTLTAQAEFLLPRAKKILAILDECDRHFNTVSNDEYVLSVGFSLGTIEECAGNIIPKFSLENPGIYLDAREYTDQQCDEAVLNADVEFGLTVGPIDNRLFDSRLLFSSQHAVIVRKEHQFAQRKSLCARDLKEIP